MTCEFCDNLDLKNRAIAENDLAFAFVSNIPIVPGHTVIAPKRHSHYYEELTAEEKKSVEDLRIKIKAALKKVFGAEGFNYAWNEEKAGGQTIPHYHLHMLPRKEGDAGVYEYEPRKFLYRPGSRAVSPDEELREVANLIKQACLQ